MTSSFWVSSDDDYRHHIIGENKDTVLQLSISLALGLGAFLTFCVRLLANCMHANMLTGARS
jgi:hypothetical protein